MQKEINIEKYGKLPPQALNLECAVLGALLIEKNRIEQVMELLTKDCFYKPIHQQIFSAIITLQSKGHHIDILTVSQQLAKDGVESIDSEKAYSYLVKISYNVVSGAHIESHCRIVMEKYLQRELIRISGKTLNSAYDDANDVFDLLSEQEYELNKLIDAGDTETITHVVEPIKEVLQDIEDLQSGAKKFMGVTTGIYMLDHLTKGWQDTDLIILAARPSQGKTALSLHHVLYAAMSGVGVAVFSLEMGSKQLVKRLISNHSGVALEKILTGQLNEPEQQLVTKSATVISSLPIYIDDRAGVPIQRICNKIKMFKRKGKIGLAVIDYLQLATVYDKKNMNREQQIAEMSRCLKLCAKDCELPIIALSQMNRSIDAAKRKPELSDLRESGAIEQDADIVIFIHHENGKTFLVVRKHRNGQTDDIEVVFLGAIQKFVDPNELTQYQNMKSFSQALQTASMFFNNEKDPF